jgi:hypothetical protein
VRANFQKSYLTRYALLAGVCLFMAAWFGYDGLIGYPAKLKMARAYDEIRELESEERIEQWKEISSSHGWPAKIPEKKAEEIEGDIVGQYFWAGLNLLVGIPALILLLRSRNSWVEATENGLTTSWGQSMNFDAVTQLNKRKWAAKGIAKATYLDAGQSRTFVFDDFKFEREPLGKMLRALEAKLDANQITGGPPERPEPLPDDFETVSS